MKASTYLPIFFTALFPIGALGQTQVDYATAIREATGRYRGDVPSSRDYQSFGELMQTRTADDRIVRERERAEALRNYVGKSGRYQRDLQEIQEAPTGPARDRLIEELRKKVLSTIP